MTPGTAATRHARHAYSPGASAARLAIDTLATAARAHQISPSNEHACDALLKLRKDKSRYALRPSNPELLESLVRLVHDAIDDSVPPTVRRTDNSHWKFWVAFCLLMNTNVWRDDHESNSGADHDGHEREVLIQAVFLVWRYVNMRPRRRADPQAKPESARKSLLAVRRAHKRRGYIMPDAPSVLLCLKGLLNQYVRLHGPESLMPHRKQPLTNEHMYSMHALVDDTTKLGDLVLSWRSLLVVCMWAFVCCLRHAGGRKADFLPVFAIEFSGFDPRRSNVEWFVGGALVADPSAAQLRALRPGDIMRVRPPPSKADAWGLTFGNATIHLPYVDDPLNAARAYAAYELMAPCHGAARQSTPMFALEGDVSLDHGRADYLFAKWTSAALGDVIAATLSLHSGRVWLACALLACKKGNPTTQALVRWKTDTSIKIYARLEPEDYVRHLLDAIDAKVTAALVAQLPPIDNDNGIARVQRDLQRAERTTARRRSASSAAAPEAPADAAAPPPPLPSPDAAAAAEASSGSDNDNDSDSDDDDADDGDVVTPGALAAPDDIVAGAEVAVCFNTANGRQQFYRGAVTRRMPRTATVRFREFDNTHLSYNVNLNRIFTIETESIPLAQE